MKRPFVTVIAIYAVGLLAAKVCQPPAAALFAVCGLVLLAAFLLEKFRPVLMPLLLALAGWANLVCHTVLISPDDLRALIGDKPAIVIVQGTLAGTPKIKQAGPGGSPAEHSLAQVRVAEIRRGRDWRRASGSIVVSTPASLPAGFFAGQSVEISGVIAPPPAPVAEGLFDYRAYLRQKGIYYQLKTESARDWNLRSPDRAPPLSTRFIRWATRTLRLGLPDDMAARLMPAMMLGQRGALTDQAREPFRESGTMHIFAISGLHVALIAGILLGLLRVVQLPRAVCGLIVLPALWFYAAATGWQPSAVRATVMMSLVIGGWMLKRPGDLLNSLAAAAFLILLWAPGQLFQASFQLSFCVVLSIAVAAPPLKRFRDRLLQTDPLLPLQLLPRWRRGLRAPLRYLGACFTLSLAAWLGSLPLVAFYFHLFSPVTVLANVVVVPLATLTLMSGLGSLLCGAWLPGAAILFNHSAWLFMHLMIGASRWAARMPGTFWYVPAPPVWGIALYFAALVGLATGWLLTRQRRVLAVTAMVLMSAGLVWHWRMTRDEIRLTVLPLKGGQAVFTDAAGRNNDSLVDCGDSNAVQFTLAPFLQGQGVNWLPRLVLTEGHLRAVGGAESLDALFGVGGLWTSRVKFRSAVYRRTVAYFEKPPSRHKTLVPGDAAGVWRVLFPFKTNHVSRADDAALVLSGNFFGTKILLLSDLSRAGQDQLLSDTNGLRADIVVAGLPGQGGPLCNDLLDAVRPKVVVIADSEFPATRRASRELKERLAQRNIPVIYTRNSGAATVLVNRGGWELRTMDGQRIDAARNLPSEE